MKTFTSADGSTRCISCGLHPDACTCVPAMPFLKALAEGLGVLASDLEKQAKEMRQRQLEE
jgi:hypothetical protein